jgi:hypothetical protein
MKYYIVLINTNDLTYLDCFDTLKESLAHLLIYRRVYGEKNHLDIILKNNEKSPKVFF